MALRVTVFYTQTDTVSRTALMEKDKFDKATFIVYNTMFCFALSI